MEMKSLIICGFVVISLGLVESKYRKLKFNWLLSV